jgi:methionine-rich copper-binding protein CopC
VSRYSGVDAVNPLGNIVSGNTMGVNGACSGGVDNNSYSFDLTTIPQDGAVVYGAAAMRNHIHTPGAGYTERAEIMQGGKASVAVQDQSVVSASAVIVNGSFDDTVDWAVVAVEIRPQLGVSKSAAGEPITANSLQVTSYQLEQNYPNPFNPGTSIRYSLPQAGEVRLTIYNIYGQTVSVPVNGLLNAGTYVVDWQAVDTQGRPLPSGVYFYRLQAGSHIVTRRMTLLR